MIGDTDETDLLLSDAMIAIYVSGGALAQSSEYLAGAECATAIAAKFARLPLGVSEGGAEVNWGVMAKRYTDIAEDLRKTDAAISGGDADGLFDWAEFAVDDFSARELQRNAVLRNSG